MDRKVVGMKVEHVEMKGPVSYHNETYVNNRLYKVLWLELPLGHKAISINVDLQSQPHYAAMTLEPICLEAEKGSN